jgi:HAD superfamily hydrolase (TIGR01509 family)
MASDIDLVIFDCDGVLVDSEKLSVEVDRRVLAELGWSLTVPEIVRRFVGRSAAHFRAEVEAQLGIRLADDWEAPYQQWYVDAFERDLQAVNGVEYALDQLTVPACVASSGPHEKIRRTLGLTGLLPRFAGAIYSVDDVTNGKPAPDLFLHAAARQGVEPSRCVVIEDSRFGVAAARAAGMRAFGYAGGLTPAEWLEGADTTVFTDMTELPALLGM